MIRSRVTLATIEAAAIAALRVSPSTTARCGGCERAEPEAVHEARLRLRREVAQHSAERPEIRAVQTVPVDLAGRDDAHRYVRRGVEDGAQKQLAHLGIDLLRVVQQGERPRSTAVQRRVVEEDAGDDERPCERASTRLVGTRDEADAEPPVETQESLSGLRGHWLRGYRSTRNVFVIGFVRTGSYRRPGASSVTAGAARGSAPSCRRDHGGSRASRD